MKKLSSLSIFFPAYNDEKTISGLVKNAYKYGALVAKKFEVIVIDDGSQDKTAEVLRQAQKEFPGLKIVTHHQNCGYGGALKSGFANSSGDYIFYTDGDGQYDVGELPLLVAKMDKEIAVVNGYKDGRQDTFFRFLAGKVYTFFLKLIFGIKIRDVDCDFRLIKKEVFEKVKLSFDSGAICLELVKKIQDAGFKFAEVKVSHLPRKYGRSQFFTFKRIWQTLVDDFNFWILLHFKK